MSILYDAPEEMALDKVLVTPGVYLALLERVTGVVIEVADDLITHQISYRGMRDGELTPNGWVCETKFYPLDWSRHEATGALLFQNPQAVWQAIVQKAMADSAWAELWASIKVPPTKRTTH